MLAGTVGAAEVLGTELKLGGLIVEVVEPVVVRWNVGRKFACDGIGMEGESTAGEEGAPSNGDGDAGTFIVSFDRAGNGYSRSSGAGVALGEATGVTSSLLALLSCLEGDAGLLKLLEGLANGLTGRSDV